MERKYLLYFFTGIFVFLFQGRSWALAQTPACPYLPGNLSVSDPLYSGKLNFSWQDNSGGVNQEDYYHVLIPVPSPVTRYGVCDAVDSLFAPDTTNFAVNLQGQDYYNCNVQFNVCAGKSGCSENCTQKVSYMGNVPDIKADINNNFIVDQPDLDFVGNCFDQSAVNGVWQNDCGYADIIGPQVGGNPGPPDGRVNVLDLAYVGARVGSKFCSCLIVPTRIPTYGATPTPTPTPAPCPRNVYGYVQRTDGTKYPGAQVSAWSKSCINCSSENYVTTTTDNNGYWSLYTGQISSPYEVRIYEEQNAPGTSDSTQNPFLPGCATISSIFDKNTVSWQSPSCTTCGPFIFYDTGNVIPTPTPIPANPYCSGAPCNFYPQGPYQEADNGAAGGSLSKDWSAYVNFTPSFSGSLNGVRVKVNVWTAGILGCKITNSAGTVDLTPGESTVSLNTGVNQWPCVSFPSFNVTAGTTYRLYCRNASWGDFRWRSNGGTETSTRTYAACIFPIIPTPTPTCTKSCPEAPLLLNPNNLQVISSPDVTLKWQQINNWGYGCPNTDTYKVYFANSFNGGNLDDDDPNGPDSVNPPATQIAKTGLTAGNYYWQVKTDNNGGISCPTSFSFIRSFTVTAGVNPWFQTKGGAIHANGTISSAIPACAPTPRYFSLDGDGGSPGLVSWQSATAPSLQDGSLSSKNWQAGSYPYSGAQQKFDYLSRLLGISTTDSFSSSPITISSLNSGTYYSASARDISGSFPTGKKIVIFINGNTTVNNNIEVNQGDFFALIVKGNLTFKDTVTKAQGYFLADGQIITQTNGTTDTAFEGQGSFIAWSGFDFNRNLGAGNCNPGETFIERPDFSYNAPIGFLSSHHTFQEVAP